MKVHKIWGMTSAEAAKSDATIKAVYQMLQILARIIDSECSCGGSSLKDARKNGCSACVIWHLLLDSNLPVREVDQ